MTTLDVQVPDWGPLWMERCRWKSVRGGRGSAKALRDDTPIPTPTGWTVMGDLAVGDVVLGSDGRPTRVTGVHPQGERPEWVVKLRHADPIYCDADHLWRVTVGEDRHDWVPVPPMRTAYLAGVLHGRTFAIPANGDPRLIERVAPTGRTAPMTCITVEAADAMFLAGRDLIPTHNSHTVSQMAVLRMANLLPAYHDGFEPVRIVSARAFQVAIKDSVKQVVTDYIRRFGLWDEFEVLDTLIRHANGSEMMFPGIERSLVNIPSLEGIDVFWMEQAETLTAEQWRIIGPTIRKANAERWFVWNPHKRSDWSWQRLVRRRRPEDLCLVANWRNNPWWEQTGLEEDRLDDLDSEPEPIYRWIWEGEPLDDDGDTAILPYSLLRKCVEAFERFAPEGGDQTHAGLDLAEGGADKCALVIREGPVVRLVDQWPGVTGDLSVAAERSWDLSGPYEPTSMYYDASSPARTDLLRVGFSGVKPVNFGGSIGGPDRMYERNRRNSDVFARRNMQMAQALRLRANRTRKLLRGDPDVHPDDCLFIPPDLPDLEGCLIDWSQPTRRYNTTTGRWELEKADVGERSPDRFDALCLAFAWETDGRGLRAR